MEPDKLSLIEFLGRVKIGQLYGTLGTVIGLIAASFALGFKTSTTVNTGKINAKDAEIVTLNGRIDSLEGDVAARDADLDAAQKQMSEQADKDRFLSLYLRYEIAKRKLSEIHFPDSSDSDPRVAEYKRTQTALDNFVDDWFGDPSKLGKGEEREAVVKFSDGTKWTLPEELTVVAEP